MTPPGQRRAGRFHPAFGLAIALGAAGLAGAQMSLPTDLEINGREITGSIAEDGTTTLMVTGGFVLTYADLEIYADSLVAWFKGQPDAAPVPAATTTTAARPHTSLERAEIYAEGRPVLVVRGLARGTPGTVPGDPRVDPVAVRQLTADRLYFDLNTGTGIVLAAAARSLYAGRDYDLPLVVRAEEIRMTPEGVLAGQGALVSTCDFGDPHWRLEPRAIVVSEGSRPGAKHVEITDTTLRVGTVPIVTLGRVGGEIGPRSLGRRLPLQRVRAGQSSQLGAFLQTDWGGELTHGLDWVLEVDGYTKRGPAGGVDLLWQALGGEGFVDTYIINDFGDESHRPRPRDLRGRVRGTHRQPLGAAWRLDLEGAYASDEFFLEEFFEDEAKTGKDPESVAYLRYRERDLRLFALAEAELEHWDSDTEYLPQFGLDLTAAPILDGRAFVDASAEVANLRREIDGARPQTWRAHGAPIVGLPIALGPLRGDVFGGAAGTTYDRALGAESTDRLHGLAGGRLAADFSRVGEIQWPWRGPQRVRHVVSPEVAFVGIFGNEDPRTVIFDEIDTREELALVRVGLLNRLQAKEVISPEREGDGRTDGRFLGRPDELLYLDVEAYLYPEAERDNDGEVLGLVDVDGTFRLTRGLDLVLGAMIGGGRRPTLDELSLGLDWRHSFGPSHDEDPVDRMLEFYLGHRHRDELASVTSLDLEARFDRRWGARLAAEMDWERGDVAEIALALDRHTHDFVFSLGIEWDPGEDDLGFSFAVALEELARARRPGDTGRTPVIDQRDRARRDRRNDPRNDGMVPDAQGN